MRLCVRSRTSSPLDLAEQMGVNTAGAESAAGADMMHRKELDSALRSLDGGSSRREG